MLLYNFIRYIFFFFFKRYSIEIEIVFNPTVKLLNRLKTVLFIFII